jgi:hypothetical protein
MTIFISHRGNLLGKDLNLENNPTQVESVIKKGYDCEIDLHMVGKKLFLGHDEPQYDISINWLLEHSKRLWIHAKNFDALNLLNSKYKELNYFWHQEDDFTLTSDNLIWTFPEKQTSHNSIIVKLEYEADYLKNNIFYGICSDYIERYRNEI